MNEMFFTIKRGLHIGGLCVFVVWFASCRSETKKQRDGQLPSSVFLKSVVDQIEKLTIANINKQIENQHVYFGRDSLQTVSIAQLLIKQKFFFYFSKQTCPPCILQTVDCIKTVFPNYEADEEIYFISPDYPARLKEDCHGKKLLTLQKNKLGLPLEDVFTPFIFTLDVELRVNTLHIINKNDFSKTIEYLEKIKNL